MQDKKNGPNDAPHSPVRVEAIKQSVRDSAIAARKQLPDSLRKEYSTSIVRAASRLLEDMIRSGQLQTGDIIHLFRSFGEEVSTDTLLETITGKGFSVAVPVVSGRGAGSELVLSLVEEGVKWVPGPFDIPQPVPLHPLSPSRVALFFLPGVAFDRMGGRVGYGKGYYDRLLDRLLPAVPKVALAFSCQLLPEVPVTPRDVPMTMILTEKESIRCDRQKKD